MPALEPVHRKIEKLVFARREALDAEVLEELRSLEPLPDETSTTWSTPDTWGRAYLFVALADIAAQRRLTEAAPLLLERASYGDPGSMMRDLRHALEGIFDPDWNSLTELCVRLSSSSRPGTRQWCVEQLGTGADPSSEGPLRSRLADEAPLVREAAQRALARLGR